LGFAVLIFGIWILDFGFGFEFWILGFGVLLWFWVWILGGFGFGFHVFVFGFVCFLVSSFFCLGSSLSPIGWKCFDIRGTKAEC
jgi:hypothetical protein